MKGITGILVCLLVLLLFGCSDSSSSIEQEEHETGVELEENELTVENGQSNSTIGDKGKNDYSMLEPKEYEYQEGDYEADFNKSIFNTNLYDDVVIYKEAKVEYPRIGLKPELEDYLVESDWKGEGKYDDLVAMFYDKRTLEMGEDALLDMFIDYGYFLYFHYGKADSLNFRIIEIQERDSLSTYPCRIVAQSWDEEYIYVMDMTADIPRKVRNLMVIDDREYPQMIIHASGFDGNYVAEEHLLFFAFKRTGWVPCHIELEFSEPEEFVVTYYSDGIAFSPGRLKETGSYVNFKTYRLGASEEIAKNRSFRMLTISEVVGVTVVSSPFEGNYYKSKNYIDFIIAEE